MLKDEYKVYEEKMKKSIESVMSDFDTVRAGRANASVLNRISVDYYGTPTPIQQIGSIGSPDPRTLVITPWDASILKGIEKAIQESDLGINPQNDGKCIRLAFPQLTEERRKELVKQIHKYAENGKVAVRNIRRDAMDNFKKQQKASEITEDELKIAEKDLQKLTDDSCKKLDELLNSGNSNIFGSGVSELQMEKMQLELKKVTLEAQSGTITQSTYKTIMEASKKELDSLTASISSLKKGWIAEYDGIVSEVNITPGETCRSAASANIDISSIIDLASGNTNVADIVNALLGQAQSGITVEYYPFVVDFVLGKADIFKVSLDMPCRVTAADSC